MLKFVPEHLNTKTMCKHAVKKLPLVTGYVPDQYRVKKRVIKIF